MSEFKPIYSKKHPNIHRTYFILCAKLGAFFYAEISRCDCSEMWGQAVICGISETSD